MSPNISRSALIRGAWSAPVVLAASNIPVYAASPIKQAEPVSSFSTVASGAGFSSSDVNYYSGQHPLGSGMCPSSSDGSVQICSAGRVINSLGVTPEGYLVPGYGDWNANLDSFSSVSRVELQPYQPVTGEKVGASFILGSEASEAILSTPTALYAPSIDPSDKAPSGYTRGNIPGYAVWTGGRWSFVELPQPQTHVFKVEVASDGTVYTSTQQNNDGVIYEGNKEIYRYSGGALCRIRQLAVSDTHVYAYQSVNNDFGLVEIDRVTHEVTRFFKEYAPRFLSTEGGSVRMMTIDKGVFDPATRTVLHSDTVLYPVSDIGRTSYISNRGNVVRSDGSGHFSAYSVKGASYSDFFRSTSFAIVDNVLYAGQSDGTIKKMGTLP